MIFKLQMKIGFLYEIVNNKKNAYEFFTQSYKNMIGHLQILKRNFDIWEIKAVADALMIKSTQYLVEINDPRSIITLFQGHYSLFKQQIEKSELDFLFMVL